MPRLPGINHMIAIRALQRVGFEIIRQGSHIVMSDGTRQIVVPRSNPIQAFTLGGIVQDDEQSIGQRVVDDGKITREAGGHTPSRR